MKKLIEILEQYCILTEGEAKNGAFNQHITCTGREDILNCLTDFYEKRGYPSFPKDNPDQNQETYLNAVVDFIYELFGEDSHDIILSDNYGNKYFKIPYEFTQKLDNNALPKGWSVVKGDKEKRYVYLWGLRKVFETGRGSQSLTTEFQEVITCIVFNFLYAYNTSLSETERKEKMITCINQILAQDSNGKLLTAAQKRHWVNSWFAQADAIYQYALKVGVKEPRLFRYNSSTTIERGITTYNTYLNIINQTLNIDIPSYINDGVIAAVAKNIEAQLKEAKKASFTPQKDNIDKSDVYLYSGVPSNISKICQTLAAKTKPYDPSQVYQPMEKVSDLMNPNETDGALLVGISLKKVATETASIHEIREYTITKINPETIKVLKPVQHNGKLANECNVEFSTANDRKFVMVLRSFGRMGMEIKQLSKKDNGSGVFTKGIALGKTPVSKVKSVLNHNDETSKGLTIPQEMRSKDWETYVLNHLNELNETFGWNIDEKELKTLNWGKTNIATQEAWQMIFGLKNAFENNDKELVAGILADLANWALAAHTEWCFPFIIVK